MRKITLKEWAKERDIHYTTALNRFEWGLMHNAYEDKINKIFVYVKSSQEEDELTRLYDIDIKRIQKEDALRMEAEYIRWITIEWLAIERLTKYVPNEEDIMRKITAASSVEKLTSNNTDLLKRMIKELNEERDNSIKSFKQKESILKKYLKESIAEDKKQL